MILTIKHTIRLIGPAARGARISRRILSALLDDVADTAQRSLRLRIEGRSNLHGKPSWLDDATDFDVVGISAGSTVLEIEAPTLGEAAPAAFQHLPLWENAPIPSQTAIMLAEEVFRAAISGNTDSYLLDRHILVSVSGFHRILEFGFEGIVLQSGTLADTLVTIDRAGLAIASRLERSSPDPVRTIVSGWLDELRGSDRAFQLVLAAGQRLSGILPPGDPSRFGSFWTKKVVVDGEATFKPSGAPARIIATNIQLAGPSDVVYEQLPRPNRRGLDDLKLRHSLPVGSSGFKRILGRWPGEETDEQVERVLAEMS